MMVPPVVALEQCLMFKKMSNMTQALLGALQQMGKSSSEGQLCTVPMSTRRALVSWLCALS